ncbi:MULTISPECIES: hypothetical protein [Gordonia]|uniref:hypothetical protein n=1 Tax=Gordonia TaxID=2053 RepID=UPI0015FC50E1|nr:MULTISPECIES: hypothetical protein [Gordonia]MDJ0010096.1 hypothetical protein [Gordonia alkanivorans]MDJ0495714.1 hypothetical protein [Gordonia alkanivorans]QMU19352.1 hypothetical protein H3V45_14760 [Gordonia rubripertincta]
MKIKITPAHSPDLLCEFEIPRKSGKAIEFSVVRMEYTPPEKQTEFDAWFEQRVQPKPVLDENGEQAKDEFDNPKYVEQKPLTDREITLKMLEICGVSKTTINQLDKLTNGEITEIWKQWNDASKVTMGESGASGTS